MLWSDFFLVSEPQNVKITGNLIQAQQGAHGFLPYRHRLRNLAMGCPDGTQTKIGARIAFLTEITRVFQVWNSSESPAFEAENAENLIQPAKTWDFCVGVSSKILFSQAWWVVTWNRMGKYDNADLARSWHSVFQTTPRCFGAQNHQNRSNLIHKRARQWHPSWPNCTATGLLSSLSKNWGTFVEPYCKINTTVGK